MLDQAIHFAALAHAKQRRKYDGLPYIVHPINVMVAVGRYGGTEAMMAAAVLHDVVEDCPVSITTIERRFGLNVSRMVFDLTDQYTHLTYPKLNRERRKALEVERLAFISPEAATIKVCDMMDNTSSIVAHDPGFAWTYLREKQRALEVLKPSVAGLLLTAKMQIEESLELLKCAIR